MYNFLRNLSTVVNTKKKKGGEKRERERESFCLYTILIFVRSFFEKVFSGN